MLPLVEDFYTLQGEGAWTGTAAWFIRLGGCDVGCSWCDAKETWNPKIHPLVPVSEVVSRVGAADVVVVTGGEPLMWDLGELTERLRARGVKTHLETSGSHPFTGSWDWVCLSPKRKNPPRDEAWARANELKVIIETPEDLEWAEKCAEKITNYELRITNYWSEAQEAANCRSSSRGRLGARRGNHPSKFAQQLRGKFAQSAQDEAGKAVVGDEAEANSCVLFLQPEWSRREEMMPVLVEYIKKNPRWRMSLQAHKYMRIP